MRLSVFPAVLFAATAVSGAAIEKRDARTVINSINAAVTSGNTLNQQLNSFTGDLVTGIGVLMQSEDLVAKVNQIITDARASTTFSATDSSQVATLMTGTLGTALENNAKTLVAKKEVFRASFRGLALGQLINMKAQAKTLYDTVGSKLASASVASVNTFSNRLQQTVEDAIVVFEGMRPPVAATKAEEKPQEKSE